MPLNGDRCDVVRIVEGLEGEVPLEMLLDVRFGYGADTPWITQAGRRAFTSRSAANALVLRTPVPCQVRGRALLARS